MLFPLHSPHLLKTFSATQHMVLWDLPPGPHFYVAHCRRRLGMGSSGRTRSKCTNVPSLLLPERYSCKTIKYVTKFVFTDLKWKKMSLRLLQRYHLLFMREILNSNLTTVLPRQLCRWEVEIKSMKRHKGRTSGFPKWFSTSSGMAGRVLDITDVILFHKHISPPFFF